MHTGAGHCVFGAIRAFFQQRALRERFFAVSLLSLLSTLAPAEVIVHDGAVEPISEGWFNVPFTSVPAQGTAVFNDHGTGLDAWSVHGPQLTDFQLGGSYGVLLSDSQIQGIVNGELIMKARLRLERHEWFSAADFGGAGILIDIAPWNRSFGLSLWEDGGLTDSFVMLMEGEGGIPNYTLYREVVDTGYHDLEIRIDGQSRTADYLVDGRLLRDDGIGYDSVPDGRKSASFRTFGPVIGNFNRVELTMVPEMNVGATSAIAAVLIVGTRLRFQRLCSPVSSARQ